MVNLSRISTRKITEIRDKTEISLEISDFRYENGDLRLKMPISILNWRFWSGFWSKMTENRYQNRVYDAKFEISDSKLIFLSEILMKKYLKSLIFISYQF